MGLPAQLVSRDLDCRQQLQRGREQRSFMSELGLAGAQDICAITVFRSPGPIYPSLFLPLSSHIRRSGPNRCSSVSSVWKRPPLNSNASGEPQSVEELWKEYFADPRQWWDNRADKRNPRSPDFRHKVARKALWIYGWSTPPWVKAMLNLATEGELQPPVDYRTKDSQDTIQGSRLSKGHNGKRSIVSTTARQSRHVVQGGDGGVRMESARTTIEAISNLKNRLEQGMAIDSDIYVEVLRRCLKEKNLKVNVAKQVHDYINQSGMEQNRYVANNLMSVYFRCGELENARGVFDKLVRKNVFSWNIMIGGYAKHNHAEEAMELFNQMCQKGVQPDAFTFSSVLKACANPSALQWGKEVHAHVRHAGLESDVLVGNTLVHMYAKCGSIDDARVVFRRMEEQTVISWNVMIGGLAEHGFGQEAYELLLQMQREGWEPNALTYLSVLNPRASAGALEWVREVHRHVLEAGLESDLRVGNALLHMSAKCGSLDDARAVFERMQDRDVITWNVMIGGLAEHGRGLEAYQLFLQMQLEGFKPDAFTYSSILNPRSSAGALEWVQEVHRHVLKAGLESNLRVGNALVHIYAKCGSLDDARSVFKRMQDRGIITWNVMIGGLAEHGCGREAYELFLQMQLEGFKPDAFTYSSILNPSASAGALEWVQEVHRHILEAGLESDLRVGKALVHIYAKCGSLDDARAVFKRMEDPDVITWNVMIGGLAEHGCGLEAYELFLQMQLEGINPNAFTYSSILNPRSSAGALEWVQEVHRHILEAGLESDLRVGSALVHMYAKCGSLDDARVVFERMQDRDVITWNVMIGGLAEHGCGREAYELFLQMQLEGFKPNAFTYASILNPRSSAGALEWVKEVEKHVLEAGLESDLRVGNALVYMYAKCSSLDDARVVFERMQDRDVITWNVMIGGLAEHGCGLEAYGLFRQMQQEGFKPNAFTYGSILNPCSSAGALEWVQEVHKHVLEAGLESNLRVGSALVHMYAKCGSLDDARAVFERMQDRDVITWNVMIGGLAEHGCGLEAYVLFLQMQQEGFKPDAFTLSSILNPRSSAGALEWVKEVEKHVLEAGLESDLRVGSALVHMYAKCGSLDDARVIFERMQDRDVITWNVMIGGLAEHGYGLEAYELFLQMQQEGINPNAVTCSSILNPSASAGALEWVQEVHRHVLKAGLESDVRVGNALVHMYAKCGSLDDARVVFERMQDRDVITWNVMIGGLAEYGFGQGAYDLLLQMQLEGFNPNAVTYSSILNPCSSTGALEWVQEVHKHVLKAGLESDVRVGNALVHMYAKCGSLDDARVVFERMQDRDVITWNVMIGGLAEHGCGREAYELFLQMELEDINPNTVTYGSILNPCSSAGALEWVKEVHRHILEAGLESDLRVGNALVHMYAKCGSLDDARVVFERMQDRDVITWNVMIGGLAEHGCGLEAYELFLQMQQEGFKPNAFTYGSILNPCSSAGALEWVQEVHRHILEAGLESNLRVGSALVHMYAKCGSLDDARVVFERMQDRDVITWNVMIGGLAEHGCGLEAYELFRQMQQEGFKPDAFTYSSILNPRSSAGALEWVKEVEKHVLEAGLELDLRVGSALVHMYAKCGSLDDARVIFERMQDRDVITWNVMIGGLAEHGCGLEALEVFKIMIADGVKPNEISFVAVLTACSHSGLVDESRRLFLAMTQDYGIEPSVVLCTCMVDVLARAGHLEEAKLLIDNMPVEPNGATWGALLGACRTYGNVKLGKLAANERLKLEPKDSSAYVLLSNIYAAAGKWEEVLWVRTMMQERGIRKEPGRCWIEVDNKVHDFVVGDTSHSETEEIYAELRRLCETIKAKGYIPDTRLVLRNIEEEEKELALCSHSEKLAIAYGLMRIPLGQPIRVFKNLRVCSDCHVATKFISKATERHIVVRDANRFHHFQDGVCSCGDYW